MCARVGVQVWLRVYVCARIRCLSRCAHAYVSIFYVLAFPLARSLLDFCFPLALSRLFVIFLSPFV